MYQLYFLIFKRCVYLLGRQRYRKGVGKRFRERSINLQFMGSADSLSKAHNSQRQTGLKRGAKHSPHGFKCPNTLSHPLVLFPRALSESWNGHGAAGIPISMYVRCWDYREWLFLLHCSFNYCCLIKQY